MALAANSPKIFEVDAETDSQPVKAAAVIYEGACVGMAAGYARPAAATDVFAGFAMEKVTGGAADGDVRVTVKRKGYVKLAITSAAVSDVKKLVYNTDDATFTLTASTNTLVGRISRWISTGVVMVAFDADNTTL